MSNELFDKGDLVRLKARFHNQANRNLDPSLVVLQVQAPDGALTAYTYSDLSVTRDVKGVYYRDVSAELVGVYRFRWAATGNGQAAEEGRFVVRPTTF